MYRKCLNNITGNVIYLLRTHKKYCFTNATVLKFKAYIFPFCCSLLIRFHLGSAFIYNYFRMDILSFLLLI